VAYESYTMNATCLELWGPTQKILVHFLFLKWFYKQMSETYKDFILVFVFMYIQTIITIGSMKEHWKCIGKDE